MHGDAPSIAVIIATYNRGEDLPNTLSDVLEQLPTTGEVWVVDQSEPAVRTANRAWVHALNDSRFHWVEQEPGLPEARNTGVALSHAPIVWFVDDDVRLSAGCLQAHIDAYADPTVGGVVGRITEKTLRPNTASTANRVGRDGRVITNLEGAQRVAIQTLKGCNMSFRRQALRQAGPFDPGFTGTAFLEDADLSTRVRATGWQLRFEPNAHLTHLATARGGVRVGSQKATEIWRFHNTGRFVRKHRSATTWPLVAATFTGIALRRAVQWRDPTAPSQLLRAWVRGLLRGHDLT